MFCSVPNPVRGLEELKRVVKPNGRIIMLEHMRSKRPFIGKIMDTFNWMSLYLWGANINRDTIENIKKADLKIISLENKTKRLGLIHSITILIEL